MSEYSRRILAFSAIAVVLGICISVGIAFLPPATNVSSQTTQQTVTQTATMSVTNTVTAFSSATLESSSSAVSTSTAIQVGTTILTTISSVSSVTSSTTTGISTSVISSSSSTVISSTTTASTTTNATNSCTVLGSPVGIFLLVQNDTGLHLSGLPVIGKGQYTVNGVQCSNSVSATTNSTGWAYLGNSPGNYYVTVIYSGIGYNLTIPSRPGVESIATYYLPSGNLTISYCVNGSTQMCSS